MASAGRILILPKGNWDATTTYENLDLVAHNGKAWLAKKASVGIEPDETKTEYWHDFLGMLFTAEGMGALPKTGGYISGIFGIVNGEYYTEFHNADGRTYHRIKGSDDNYRDLILGLDIDPSYAITKDGVYSRYKLYGEHNNTMKPGVIDVASEKDIENYFSTLENNTLTTVKFNVTTNINDVIKDYSFTAMVSKLNTEYGNILGFVPAVGCVSNRISGSTWAGWTKL